MPWSEQHGDDGTSTHQHLHSRDGPDGHWPHPDGRPWGPMRSHEYEPWERSTKWTTSSQHRTVAPENRSSSSAIPSNTPLPTPIPHPDKSLTVGALAAAIVIPILTLCSAIAFLYLCLRRRKQNAQVVDAPVVAGAVMKEKLGGFSRQRELPSPSSPAEPPVLTSEENNAYYTGLDTSSFGSRPNSGDYQIRGSYEPPPPYFREPSPPPVDGRARSPFEDPPDHQRFTEDSYLAAFSGEGRSSTGEARVARSISVLSGEGSRRVSDPFVSPDASPISPGGGTGYDSPRASDISDRDRR